MSKQSFCLKNRGQQKPFRTLAMIIISSLLTVIVNAQSDSLQKQINEQVWKDFITGFSNYDTDKFMSVHSKDMMRVTQDNKSIQNYTQYYEEYRKGDARSKQSGYQRDIELRFTNRMATSHQAFEIGYYKTTSIRGEKKNSFYGKFHVALKKENGVWKILLDTDTSQGVTAEEFEKAQKMQQ